MEIQLLCCSDSSSPKSRGPHRKPERLLGSVVSESFLIFCYSLYLLIFFYWILKPYMCFWEEANVEGMLVLYPGVSQVGGVHLPLKVLNYRNSTLPLEAAKQACPDSVLLHGGCCCLWYFVYNVNLYVFVPPHTLLLLLPPPSCTCLFLSCLCVSLSFCAWNLHNVVRPSRLIIHVLLTPPSSSRELDLVRNLPVLFFSWVRVPTGSSRKVFRVLTPSLSVVTWGAEMVLDASVWPRLR